jgi:hypothetical protein
MAQPARSKNVWQSASIERVKEAMEPLDIRKNHQENTSKELVRIHSVSFDINGICIQGLIHGILILDETDTGDISYDMRDHVMPISYLLQRTTISKFLGQFLYTGAHART